MDKDNTKRRKPKPPAILSRIVMFLFLVMLMLFMNINALCYFLNRSSYETVTATVVQQTTDEFLLLIPKVEVTYQFHGQQYTEKKYFFLEPLFGLSREEGTTLTLHVNIYAPANSLFEVHFFLIILNWLLLVFEAVCIYNLIRRIRTYRLAKKFEREDNL